MAWPNSEERMEKALGVKRGRENQVQVCDPAARVRVLSLVHGTK